MFTPALVIVSQLALLAAEDTVQRATPGEISQAAAVHPDAAEAMKLVRLPKDVKISVWAAEPMLANPVGFGFDERGRVYVAETFRYRDGGTWDNRSRMSWVTPEFKKKATPERLRHLPVELLDREVSLRTTDDRVAMIREYMDPVFMKKYAERVRLIEDRDGDGRAETSTIFADGFSDPLDGVGSAVLARGGDVFFTNIPHLWRLRDRNGDGKADERTALSSGYGVRFAFTGHDLHGLRVGPDGRLYFTVGDRGAHVKTREGRVLASPDTGSVFRCELDGSELEVFATGLRNPQDLVFDEHGNLFTGDNNSDGGDKARIVYLVPGGDSGWRIGYQYIEEPVRRGPWNGERMWEPVWSEQPAHLVPPVANLTNGPSGLAHYPGTGMDRKAYAGKFLLVDFKGQSTLSGIYGFTLAEKGASFDMLAPERHIWNVLATDVDFGPDGAIYVLDWVQGWLQPGKGRIYRLTHPAAAADPVVAETRRLIAEGVGKRRESDLRALLGHPDARVRLEAQLELVRRGASAILVEVARGAGATLPRLHAVWGLGQLARKQPTRAPVEPLSALLDDGDAEVRAQAAAVAGDVRVVGAREPLQRRLSDPNARVRFYAALGLGRLGAASRDAVPAIVDFIRENADRDPLLRHAGVMALVGAAEPAALVELGKDKSPVVRLAALLALRRLRRPEVTRFLDDSEPRLVREAARAINDEQIDEGTAALASLNKIANDNPILLRVVNANFRQGSAEAAQRLAAFALRPSATAPVREEAIAALGDWARPSIRDRVTGNFHPIAEGAGSRDGAPAERALEGALAKLLAPTTPEPLRVAAIEAVQRIGLKKSAGRLLTVVATPRRDGGRARRAALAVLAAWKAPELGAAIKKAAADPDPAVRTAALGLQIQTNAAEAVGLVDRALAKGSIAEKKAALDASAKLEGDRVDALLLRELDRYAAGKFPREAALELVEATAARKASSPREKLQEITEKRPKDELAPYREALVGGDVSDGRKIFFGNQQVMCLRCHRVGGEGADVGPDLSKTARERTREYLLEAIVRPSARFAAGFESVIVTLRDGSIHGGVVKKETADAMELLTPDNTSDRVDKRQIKTREPGASGMPDGFGEILTRRELRDLVEFLATLK